MKTILLTLSLLSLLTCGKVSTHSGTETKALSSTASLTPDIENEAKTLLNDIPLLLQLNRHPQEALFSRYSTDFPQNSYLNLASYLPESFKEYWKPLNLFYLALSELNEKPEIKKVSENEYEIWIDQIKIVHIQLILLENGYKIESQLLQNVLELIPMLSFENLSWTRTYHSRTATQYQTLNMKLNQINFQNNFLDGNFEINFQKTDPQININLKNQKNSFIFQQ